MHLSLEELARHCEQFVLIAMEQEAAHDVAHLRRVVRNAGSLAATESADLYVVTAAAWLHDLVNYPKDSPRRALASAESAEKAKGFLSSIGMSSTFCDRVAHAITAHSFSANIEPKTLEACIVQDADRLDALGSIGIARCFTVGGRLNRSLYHALDPFSNARKLDDHTYTLDHFYQKLLSLADSFKTVAGREVAQQRTQVMLRFLEQLRLEIGEFSL